MRTEAEVGSAILPAGSWVIDIDNAPMKRARARSSSSVRHGPQRCGQVAAQSIPEEDPR